MNPTLNKRQQHQLCLRFPKLPTRVHVPLSQFIEEGTEMWLSLAATLQEFLRVESNMKTSHRVQNGDNKIRLSCRFCTPLTGRWQQSTFIMRFDVNIYISLTPILMN